MWWKKGSVWRRECGVYGGGRVVCGVMRVECGGGRMVCNGGRVTSLNTCKASLGKIGQDIH